MYFTFEINIRLTKTYFYCIAIVYVLYVLSETGLSWAKPGGEDQAGKPGGEDQAGDGAQ